MSFQETDLTFFTNDGNQTLLGRFKATLADTRLFDNLVGYYHSSGFYRLYDSIESDDQLEVDLKEFNEFLQSNCLFAEADWEMGNNGNNLETLDSVEVVRINRGTLKNEC
jgi:hypothetical protein